MRLADLSLLLPWLWRPRQVTAYDNGAPHSRLPPLGWSSWVALGPGSGWEAREAGAPVFDYCDEVSVKASADAFHSVGLYDAGYRHFHLDDCWADKERNATGFLQAQRDHFPNGMAPVVDYVHALGLTFGLYTCAGVYTCVGRRPGSKEHWNQDARVFAEWGVDWVKMDWCYTAGMRPAETYPKMAAPLNGTGRRIHFNLCEWGVDQPWRWGPSIAQSWRVSGDHVGTWASTESAVAARAGIPAELGGGPFAWNDMDMLETGNYRQAAHANGRIGNMTATEYKTEFSMWAILASPLIVTTPLLNCSKTDQITGNYTPGPCKASITDLQKDTLLNREVLAINQDENPAGSLAAPAGDGRFAPAAVFARQLSDGSAAVAMYNPSDHVAQGRVTFAALGPGWRADTVAGVRDLWRHQTLGTAVGRFPARGAPPLWVPPHGTILLRLTPLRQEALDLIA